MFVHPHPAFGVLSNGFFEMVPDLLGDGGDVIFGGGADGAEDLYAVGAVGPGDADTGDDGEAESLGEGGVEGGDAGFESEAFDDGGGPTGLHVEVGQEAGVALAFEALDEAEHSSI